MKAMFKLLLLVLLVLTVACSDKKKNVTAKPTASKVVKTTKTVQKKAPAKKLTKKEIRQLKRAERKRERERKRRQRELEDAKK